MKTLKKIGIFSLVGILLLAIAGFITVTVFEDDIKQYALNEIGKQLDTEIKVSAVGLTLWDQFPSASLQFDNVHIAETFEEKDTLIFAESVFLNFSISDFISGNYQVKEIAIENSQINLKRKADGLDNYHFWKESDEESAKFSIDLNSINLKNALINLDDKSSDVDLLVLANSGQISGNITSETLELEGDIDTYVERLIVNDKSYLAKKTLSGHSGININLKESIYTFSNSELAVNDLPLVISGMIDLEENSTLVDLKAQCSKSSLSAVVSNLPDFVRTNLSSFSSSGNFSTDISIKGMVNAKLFPTITASFSLNDGKLKNKTSGIALGNINTKGTYRVETGREDLLEFAQLDCSLGSGNFSGQGKISRLTNPFINFGIDGNLELETFKEFFNIKEIDHLEGLANVSFNYKGNLGKNWKPSTSSIKQADISGKVTLEDGILKLAKNPHSIDHVSGEFLLTNGDAAVNNLMAKVNDSDFEFNGFFRNFMPYLLIPEQALTIESSLQSKFIDLNTLLSSTGKSSESYVINLPERINFSLSTEIEALAFREFKAADISAKAELSQHQLKIQPVIMKTADGEFSANIIAKQQKNGDFNIKSSGNLDHVDISKLFLGFENFQQEFITNKHLKGTGTSDFTFAAVMSNTLDIKSETVDVTANIKLENGELISHKSLEEIGVYLNDKKLLSSLSNMSSVTGKLNHVRFSELTNRIVIKNKQISIPKMSIESDALNIIAEGTHSFDNRIDYSIGFDLADMGSRANNSEDERGLSKMIFVSMKGTTEHPEFGYDRLAVKEQRKENRAQEKQKIKSILRDEFSKKDTDKTASEPSTKERVTIEWSDSKEVLDKKKDEDKKRTKTSPLIIDTSAENEDDDDF